MNPHADYDAVYRQTYTGIRNLPVPAIHMYVYPYMHKCMRNMTSIVHHNTSRKCTTHDPAQNNQVAWPQNSTLGRFNLSQRHKTH